MDPTSLNRVNTNQPVVIIDGVASTPTIVQDPSSLSLTVGDIAVQVNTTTQNGNELGLTDDGRLRLVNGNEAGMQLGGFQSSSEVQVWVVQGTHANQKYLGMYTTDSDGTLTISVKIPRDLGNGNADLVVSGTTPDGSDMVVGLPVVLEMTSSSSGFTYTLSTGLLFAIGAMFIYLVLRRRKEDGENPHLNHN